LNDLFLEEIAMERRAMQRFNLSLRAILSFNNAPTRELQTKDISIGGAFFKTHDTMPEGTRVFLSLFPLPHKDQRPDHKTVENLSGKVRRRNNHGMAICFDTPHHF